jgi:hypothetical protein
MRSHRLGEVSSAHLATTIHICAVQKYVIDARSWVTPLRREVEPEETCSILVAIFPSPPSGTTYIPVEEEELGFPA